MTPVTEPDQLCEALVRRLGGGLHQEPPGEHGAQGPPPDDQLQAGSTERPGRTAVESLVGGTGELLAVVPDPVGGLGERIGGQGGDRGERQGLRESRERRVRAGAGVPRLDGGVLQADVSGLEPDRGVPVVE
ncbi:hypothetical protein [Streptomyces minutiscleroticus]|uniref:Uncharacterized protein n=1 Tax=Streptomyces minutiscleroticus TaxID=68238 RepID=A0A918UAE1_9ACTN|nr:hypothetical protein [Streptomyces minutiscleroticus]GGY16417.1 hypothetical protein GCM10010358_80160 [Streptomyces minutiscleroticus]